MTKANKTKKNTEMSNTTFMVYREIHSYSENKNYLYIGNMNVYVFSVMIATTADMIKHTTIMSI